MQVDLLGLPLLPSDLELVLCGGRAGLR